MLRACLLKLGIVKDSFVKGRASDRRSNGREPRLCSALALLKHQKEEVSHGGAASAH